MIFTKLKLINFKSHQNTVINFEKGISVDDEMIRALRDYFVEEGYFPATNERKHA